MRRQIIFIPKGETETVTVSVQHAPGLNLPGVWNLDNNEVLLGTQLWNQFPQNDQALQRKIFDQLTRVDGETFRKQYEHLIYS